MGYRFYSGAKAQLEDFANSARIKSMDWSEQKSFISQISNPNIESILIVDPTGNGNTMDDGSIDISDRKYFQEVISTQKRTIAHPDEQYIGNTDILTGQTKLQNLTDRMVQGDSGTGQYTYNGVEKELAYAPVGLAGWAVNSAGCFRS